MFARKLNNFEDYREGELLSPMQRHDLLERIETMNTVVFPAIKEKMEAVTMKQKGKFDKQHTILEFPIQSHVLKRALQKKGKLHPEYEGPYTVVRKTKGGSYVLIDEQGELLPIDIPPSQLKLISQDEIVPANEVYEIDSIIAHKKESGVTYLYKVRWKGYNAEDDTWEPYEHFNSMDVITSYWERLGVDCPHNTNANPVTRNTPQDVL